MRRQKTKRFVAVIFVALVPVLSWSQSGDTQTWIDVLKSQETPIFEKARACQQLGESGTAEAVPVLASLLGDARLSAYARAGLERIPGPAASAALRKALDDLDGTLQIGVIHSLGALRDERAVKALVTLAGKSDPKVAQAALLALGRIATEPAASVVVKALTAQTPAMRAEAAAACLLCAEQQLKRGKAEQATATYDAILKANVPLSYRIGATRGAILSRQNDQIAFLVRQWHSTEPAIRDVAVLTVRQNPSVLFAAAINDQIATAPRDLQILLIEALTDCHNAQSMPVVWGKAVSDDARVRVAALKVLERIAGPDTVPALIKVLERGDGDQSQSMATSILEQLGGAETDQLILRSLSSTTDAKVRVDLIGVLAKRSVTVAVDELLRQAAGSDKKVSIAAFQALKSLAGLDVLPELIELTRACQDNAVRDAAGLAVYGAFRDGDQGDPAASLVLAALKTAENAQEKATWIRVLCLLGHADALPAITSNLGDTDQALIQSTILHLGRWPDPAPIDALFKVVEGHQDADLRRRALATVLRLATAAADQKQAAAVDLVGWFKRAGDAAQSTQEERLIISGLGRVHHRKAVQLLATYLDQRDVRMEVVHAVLSASETVAQGPDYGVVETVLNRLTDVKEPRLVKRIADLKRGIETAKSRYGELNRRIEQNRMGELVILAEPGAKVKVEQVRHEFWFGAALSSSAFGSRMDAEAKRKYRDVFLANFNAAVTENALKWHAMERRQGQIDYSIVNAMLDWTEAHEIPLRGHNIFWGIPNRVQDWLKAMDDKALLAALRERARDIARRYKGRFAEYDLNNEMIHGNFYADRLGPGITKQMIDWIKEIDPDAKLYLNDYDILTGRRLDDYNAHIQGFIEEQAGIDGVGVQGHLHGDAFDPVALQDSLDSLARNNLPICVTEFNFPGQRSSVYQRRDVTLTPEQEQAKAEAIVQYYSICFAHPAVKGILMWGFWEGANWIPQSSMYKRDWTPTPSVEAYQDLVFDRWWTQWQGKADDQGQCRVPAFFGKHRVTVDGREKTVALKKVEGKETVSFR